MATSYRMSGSGRLNIGQWPTRFAWSSNGTKPRIDARRAYGEERFKLPGRIDGRLFVEIYTLRGPVFRIISARKANAREVKRYENHAQKSH